MIAISLHQPWAMALFAPRETGGARTLKIYETRGWVLPARFIGVPVAIHAAKRDTAREKAFWEQQVIGNEHRGLYARAFACVGVETYGDLPRGMMIGTVVFGPAIEASASPDGADEIERHWGDFSEGRFVWPTVTRVLFAKPIPCLGRQGFFHWAEGEQLQGGSSR